MKLSDKDLHYALWCAEKHTGNSLYAEAMADLEEVVLEIEGYERSANVGSPEIDGKPLSEGEIALIRAIRRGTRLIDPLRQIQKEQEASND